MYEEVKPVRNSTDLASPKSTILTMADELLSDNNMFSSQKQGPKTTNIILIRTT